MMITGVDLVRNFVQILPLTSVLASVELTMVHPSIRVTQAAL